MKVPQGIEQSLVAAADLFNSPPLLLLLVGHCLACANFVRGKYGDRWLINNLAGFAIAFGGGSMSALLLQDPGRVPIAVFSGDVLLLIWGLSWWALSYSPFNVVGRLMDLRPVTTLANVALSILRAGIIAQRVDYMVATYPGHNIAAIVIAIIASCGGGMIVDALDIGAGYSKGPAELATPGFVLRSGAFLAIFHLASVHLLGLLSSRASLGVITTLFVAHTLASAILQAPLDYTRPLGILLHKVTNIPVPVGGKTKAPPSKPVTRSQAALSKEVDGHQEQYPSTPSSSKQTPRRRTTAGKRE
ncbi:hypothetical protein ACKKBG_A15790 [Auxenochlorella protothecoides x Auxenochlorella symbiontica]